VTGATAMKMDIELWEGFCLQEVVGWDALLYDVCWLMESRVCNMHVTQLPYISKIVAHELSSTKTHHHGLNLCPACSLLLHPLCHCHWCCSLSRLEDAP
jgi:hypothetical protein